MFWDKENRLYRNVDEYTRSLDPADYVSMNPTITVLETGDVDAGKVNVNDLFLAQPIGGGTGTAVPIKVLFKGANYIGICKYDSVTLMPSEIVPISIKTRSKENKYLSGREETMHILKNVKLFRIDTVFELYNNNNGQRNQRLFRMVAKKWGQIISPLLQVQDRPWWNRLDPVSYSMLSSDYSEGNSASMLLNDRVFLCTSENDTSTTNMVMICVVTVNRTGGWGGRNEENEIQVHWYSIKDADPLTFIYTDGLFVRTGINVTRNGDYQKFQGAHGTYNDASSEALTKLNNLKFYKLPDLPKSSGGKKRSIKNVKKRKSARKGNNNNNKRKSNRRVKRSRSRSRHHSRL